MELNKKNYWIFEYDGETWTIIARTPKLARKLNNIAGSYPEDTKFRPGDEPPFRFKKSPQSRQEIARALGIPLELLT